MEQKRDILRISLQAVLAGGLGFLMMYIIGPMMDDIKENRENLHKLEIAVTRQQTKIEQLEE